MDEDALYFFLPRSFSIQLHSLSLSHSFSLSLSLSSLSLSVSLLSLIHSLAHSLTHTQWLSLSLSLSLFSSWSALIPFNDSSVQVSLHWHRCLSWYTKNLISFSCQRSHVGTWVFRKSSRFRIENDLILWNLWLKISILRRKTFSFSLALFISQSFKKTTKSFFAWREKVNPESSYKQRVVIFFLFSSIPRFLLKSDDNSVCGYTTTYMTNKMYVPASEILDHLYEGFSIVTHQLVSSKTKAVYGEYSDIPIKDKASIILFSLIRL